MTDEHKPVRLPPDGGRAPGEALLEWIKRKDLQVPAEIFLEMHRPLLPLAWSVAILVGGFLAPFFGPDYYQKAEALRDPQFMDRILERLREPKSDDADD